MTGRALLRLRYSQSEELVVFSQAVDLLAHLPSTQAAASQWFEPEAQSQQDGAQSDQLEQDSPSPFVPVSVPGLEGQAPFVCSVFEDELEDELLELLLLLLPFEPLSPDLELPSLPPPQAAREKASAAMARRRMVFLGS